MTALVWDQVGERYFESGVSHGVLYDEEGRGFAWNGITSVDESSSKSVDPIHFDGVKFNDIVKPGDFAGTLKAFTYPNKFREFEGVVQDQTGFYVTAQPSNRFALSYQTRVSNDIDQNAGYKIHVLYNLTAVPSQRTFNTLSEDVEAVEFEWALTSIPDEVEKFRPTSHIIFDSRQIDPYLLVDVEEILYGSVDADPQLPSLKGLAAFVRKWERLVITDHGDGTWEAYSPLEGVINMLDSTTFEIISDTAVYLDADSYEISSSEKNQEDIWQP
jgi:hypothetical protein